MKVFNFIDLCLIKLLEIELFDPLYVCINKMCWQIIYLMQMYKQGLALNNQQWFICHKTKPNQTNSSISSQLNDFKYCYLTREIQFNIIHSFEKSFMVPGIAM